jgi:DNA-binding NarL/FixJ family response regulator
LVSEGKTNQQIADLRQRSLSATEGTITRAFTAIGIDTSADVNSRVLAATTFLVQSGLMNN